jgi:hypothetical protein
LNVQALTLLIPEINRMIDTGATTTLINGGLLLALGYDPASDPDHTQITTRSGVEYVRHVGRANKGVAYGLHVLVLQLVRAGLRRGI